MADAMNNFQSMNKEVADNQNNIGIHSAYNVVAMATASALQNEMAMHAGFETTSNTVLALAMEKMVQAAAEENPAGIEIWQKVITTINQSRAAETENVDKFNKIAENLVKSFPKN